MMNILTVKDKWAIHSTNDSSRDAIYGDCAQEL